MIYFVKPVGEAGPIKIGFSRTPEQRLAGLQPNSPVRLEIVALMPGSIKDEWLIHQNLSEHHSHGEWFHPCRRIDVLIETFATNPFAADLTGPRRCWKGRPHKLPRRWISRPVRDGVSW